MNYLIDYLGGVHVIYQALTIFITAIGGVVAWYYKTKEAAQKIEIEKLKAEAEARQLALTEKEQNIESEEMLYEQLEILKKKLILSSATEVEQALEIAAKDREINTIKIHCKECYETYILNSQ